MSLTKLFRSICHQYNFLVTKSYVFDITLGEAGKQRLHINNTLFVTVYYRAIHQGFSHCKTISLDRG